MQIRSTIPFTSCLYKISPGKGLPGKGLLGLISLLLLSACDNGDPWAVNTEAPTTSYTVSASVAGTGGSINRTSANVNKGATTSFTITPDPGYSIASVTGCGGTLAGNTYTTAAVTGTCTVTATFSLNSYTVSATAGTGGSISPASVTVDHGATTNFTVVVDTGYAVGSISGCGITLLGNGTPNTYAYTTAAVTADCTVTVSFIRNAAQPTLSYQAVKKFRFSWNDINGATHYRLL